MVSNNYSKTLMFKEQMSKENNPNWKGGISLENNNLRNSPEYREWRKEVLKKSNCICCVCGRKDVILQVHHIENFSTNKELRLDIDNGVCICVNCHDLRFKGSFHRTYGTSNNTREQLNEYINIKQNIYKEVM